MDMRIAQSSIAASSASPLSEIRKISEGNYDLACDLRRRLANLAHQLVGSDPGETEVNKSASHRPVQPDFSELNTNANMVRGVLHDITIILNVLEDATAR